MLRGNLSNSGRPLIWIMSDVLFTDSVLRDDRSDWFTMAIDFIDIALILPLDATEPPTWGITYVKRFRHTRDAIEALKRDTRPLFLITSDIDDPLEDIIRFEDNILHRYNLIARK
jgi:hypothetical protein